MGLLNDLKAVKRQTAAHQLKVRTGQRHMVALEFLVHRRLGSHTDQVIEIERGNEQRCD